MSFFEYTALELRRRFIQDKDLKAHQQLMALCDRFGVFVPDETEAELAPEYKDILSSFLERQGVGGTGSPRVVEDEVDLDEDEPPPVVLPARSRGP